MASSVKTSSSEGVLQRIASLEALDAPAERVQGIVSTVTKILGRDVVNMLHGTWLGHPLHPVMTDVPIGSWTATMVFDVLEMAGSERARKGGDVSVAVGLAGAVGAAITGLNDWQHTAGGSRRIGMVHASLNGLGTMLYTASMMSRLSGNRGRGLLFSMMGMGVVTASAYLGGALVYHEAIGVDHARGTRLPPGPNRVARLDDLREGEPRRVEVQGARVLLVRQGQEVSAIAETCAHLGGPLAEGKLDGDTITCPWHGSKFDVKTGALLDGPSVYPQPCFTARVRDGWVEVEG